MSALVACNKDLPGGDVQNTGDVVTYTATVDGADTKTVIDGRLSKWENGDKITLHNGTTAFEFSTTDAGTTANFTYAGNDFSAENGVMAVYPAQYTENPGTENETSHTYAADLSAKTVTAHIPTWQQAREGSYNRDAAVAVAYSENNSLAFKNATALLKFTVKNDNVTHFNFYGKNSEPLSGDVLITLNDDDNTIKSVVPQEMEGAYRTNVEVYAWQSEDVLYFKSGATYYAAIAPQTLAGFGIKLRVNGTDQEVKAYDGEFEFNANTIYDLGELEYIVPETVAKLYVENHTGWDELALYMWGTPNDAMGGWPGSLPSATEVKGETTYNVYDIPATVLGTEQNLIFNNNNNGQQAPDYKYTFAEGATEIYMYVNEYGAIAYNYGDTPTPPAAPEPTPEPEYGKTIYLIPNGVWDGDSNVVEVFEAWYWGSDETGAWAVFTETSETGVYSAKVSQGATGIIFLRKSPDHLTMTFDVGGANQYWNRIDTSIDGNCLTVKNWSVDGAVNFEWSTK